MPQFNTMAPNTDVKTPCHEDPLSLNLTIGSMRSTSIESHIPKACQPKSKPYRDAQSVIISSLNKIKTKEFDQTVSNLELHAVTT